MAGALSRHGFGVGDRLAILLPNETEYIELVYACAWLGVIAVPLNARFSAVEVDRVLADASPRGMIRHSSLPVPTVQLSWQLVIDEQPLRNQARMLDRIAVEITFIGDLSDDQRHRLLEIANICPVHRTLVSEVQIRTRLAIA
jgi:acyl-CoA synthetase (AMP-forming)/AMP-acid ligase II